MANNVDISVVIPVFNAEAYLAECIASVLTQTLLPKEIIVVDDASTDGTCRLIKQQMQLHPQIQLLQLPPKKNNERRTALALNTGIAKCKCTLIALMDADDICFPQRFQIQADFLTRNQEICAVGSSIQIINKQGKKGTVLRKPADGKSLCMQLPSASPFYQNTVMFRSALLKDTELIYDESVEYAEDYDFFSRLARKANIANIDQPLVYYRQHEEQSVRSVHFIKAVQQISIREAMLSFHFSYTEAQQFWEFVNHRNGLNGTNPKDIRRYAKQLKQDNMLHKSFPPNLFDHWVDGIVFNRLFSRKEYRIHMLAELFAYKPFTLFSSRPLHVLIFIVKCIFR